MNKILVLLALAPLTLSAGMTSAIESSGCAYSGGETVEQAMIPLPEAAPADGMYLHASATSGKSGLYAEDNGKAGLQVTDLVVTCGPTSATLRRADSAALDAVT